MWFFVLFRTIAHSLLIYTMYVLRLLPGAVLGLVVEDQRSAGPALLATYATWGTVSNQNINSVNSVATAHARSLASTMVQFPSVAVGVVEGGRKAATLHLSSGNHYFKLPKICSAKRLLLAGDLALPALLCCQLLNHIKI